MLAAGSPFLLFWLFAIGLLITAVFKWGKEGKRTNAMRAWAKRYGYTFAAARDRSLMSHVGHFDCFNKGDDRYAANVLQSRRDSWDLTIFDWHYETTSTDSKGRRRTSHHWSSNVLFDVDFLLSPLVIRRESFFDKMSQAFGWDDIDFESAEFSSKFHVSAKDRRWAFEFISPKSMEVLLNSPTFRIEMQGRQLLIRRDRRISPAELGQATVLGQALLQAVPADVVEERRSRLRAGA